ncbi:hypothetical protein ACFTAO_20855 [Paenibacillus rhizoplanae]
MLVLDIGGDNYHVLQGKSIDRVLTNDRISGILNTVLEPKFAAKDYAGGATGTANAFYSFFLARADAASGKAAGSSASAAASTVSKAPVTAKEPVELVPVSRSKGMMILGIFPGSCRTNQSRGCFAQPLCCPLRDTDKSA